MPDRKLKPTKFDGLDRVTRRIGQAIERVPARKAIALADVLYVVDCHERLVPDLAELNRALATLAAKGFAAEAPGRRWYDPRGRASSFVPLTAAEHRAACDAYSAAMDEALKQSEEEEAAGKSGRYQVASVEWSGGDWTYAEEEAAVALAERIDRALAKTKTGASVIGFESWGDGTSLMVFGPEDTLAASDRVHDAILPVARRARLPAGALVRRTTTGHPDRVTPLDVAPRRPAKKKAATAAKKSKRAPRGRKPRA